VNTLTVTPARHRAGLTARDRIALPLSILPIAASWRAESRAMGYEYAANLAHPHPRMTLRDAWRVGGAQFRIGFVVGAIVRGIR
jgi:hypothetical protein